MTNEEVALHVIHATGGDTKRLNEASALIELHVTEALAKHGIKKLTLNNTRKLALSMPSLDTGNAGNTSTGLGPVKVTLSDRTEYRNAYYGKDLRVSESSFDTMLKAIRETHPVDEETYIGVLRLNYHKGCLVDIKLVS